MSSLEQYILDEDHTPRAVGWDEYLAWASRGFDETKRVAKTGIGDISVSTVFLSIDHNWDDGPPILFETMVFGGTLDEHQWRYTSWDEAVAGHKRVVAAIREGRDPG